MDELVSELQANFVSVNTHFTITNASKADFFHAG
jgi:hypothetical protein